MAGKFRGRSQWDPPLIIFQILAIQLLSYASISILVLFATILTGYQPNTMIIFNHSMMRLSSGKLIILAYMANSIVGAYLLRNFVERAKLCLDFSLTYHVIHFSLVWIYSGAIPDTFLWYFVITMSACTMCITAEYLCRRQEMESIPITASS